VGFAYLDRSTNSETQWVVGSKLTDAVDFRTGEHFGSGHHMEGAGGYVRRMLDDKASVRLPRLDARKDVAAR
jgi:hypothetical protein